MTKRNQGSVHVVSADPYRMSVAVADDQHNDEMDNSTSSLGDDSSHDNRDNSRNPQNLTEINFMNKLDQSLLNSYDSSSDESSYWSSSDEDSDEDDDEDDDAEASSDDDEEGKSGESEDDNDVEVEDKDNRQNRRIRQNRRTNSTVSLDALLKVSMQLVDKKKPPVKDKELRRRGRRLNKDHTATSLGALARKVGSSTDNDLLTEAVAGFRRCESTTDLPIKIQPNKTKFVHIQQEGSPLKGGTTVAVEQTFEAGMSTAPVVRRSTLAKYGDHATNQKTPRDYYNSILLKAGVQPLMVSYSELEDFFVLNTPQDRAAFDMDLVQCIRDQNLPKLKELHASGHRMSARAQFGESIIHICARRGTPEMLRYLLEDAQVSPRVCCDYGRTPLHDACWSTDAKSLKMMQILMTACPDLFLILDKRGFMPLDYIPKDRWPHCCTFLDKYKESLLPTGVLWGGLSDSEEEESSEDDSDDDDDSNLDF
jgi:Ankyrin repeats (3 copies)